MNRSGVIRSVPPIGFGFWVRDLPWPYGNFGFRRIPNYLSFLHLSISVNGEVFHESEDFTERNVELYSSYHTKNMMSYDWEYRGLQVSAKYFLVGENSIVCILEMKNMGDNSREITVHATNIYGYPQVRYWGCDGLVSYYSRKVDAAVSKVWAYGDIFLLGANRKSVCYKATHSDKVWEKWIRNNDLSSNDGVSVNFRTSESVFSVISYRLNLDSGVKERIILSLTRGKNELYAIREFRNVISNAFKLLNSKLSEDEEFYKGAALLVGDWPERWKHGWIYDLETIRMNIRPPMGIYKHPWDAMQVHTPRVVLGETALDCMCLSYADMELAKEVLYGTFADAPMPNIPCSREDGSVNMICANGKECGTAPIWGLPFHVIRSIYLRSKDREWIRRLYPYLKRYIDWWFENRTDEEGWFHAACSWESGQDGSKRFLVPSHEPGAAAEFVRTVDIEAAMANALENMSFFAEIAGRKEESKYWRRLADERKKRVRAMFVDGWFRDFDARNNRPIILRDYWDIMMLMPITFNIATKEQVEEIKPMFEYFRKNPKHWLEWPSFMFPFSEAAWNAGLRKFISEVIYDTTERVYTRTDRRRLLKGYRNKLGLPKRYDYRLPGVANEFWPIDPENPGGCENYGWGATLPFMIIRNIIGFREDDEYSFILAPALPNKLLRKGRKYGVKNLKIRGVEIDVEYEVLAEKRLLTRMNIRHGGRFSVKVSDERDEVIAEAHSSKEGIMLECPMKNIEVYKVMLIFE
ncbi:MAG TPA: hypothetical protein ENF41_00695 [Candidatus Bathyarchaeota archaeon]|nr:hypothetical protein [Candidatus Bathyarchaeota archaeon]